MANRTPMHVRSALPEKDRIQTVVNEYLRRMKNCSRDLATDTLEGVLQDYSAELRRGGFSNQWIKNTLDAASRGYARMVI